MSNKRIQMLSEGPLGRSLFSLSAPAVTGMMVIAIYNIADTFFVSLLRDTAAVAATGIVFPIFQLVGAIGLTFGMGAASVISRRLGEKDYDAANHVAATALYSVVVIGLVASFVGVIFVKPILSAFGATPSILEVASLYGRVIIGGSVFQMMNMTLNNLLRSEGASLYSSAGQVLGGVLNIILDPIFIFVLDLGISGAAIATIISQGTATVWLLFFYIRRKGVLNPLSPRNIRISGGTYRDMMNLGLPTFVRQVLGSISFGILNNAAAAFGDGAIAAVSVTLRLFSLLIMAWIGLAQGLQPLAGYNYGARNFQRVRGSIRLTTRLTAASGAVAGVLSYIFAVAIMRVFVPQDPDVILMGAEAIRIMSVVLVPTGLVIIFGGIFQALGDGRSALLLAAGQQGLFLIPMVLILPRITGLTGVFTAQPAGFFLAFVIGALLLRKAMARLED